MKDDYCVYLHRRKTDGVVFYVGKGKKYRPWATFGRSQHWNNTAEKHGVTVEIVIAGVQDWYASELEIGLIALYGRYDDGYGRLVNMTDGGDGVKGKKLTAEHAKRISTQVTNWNNTEEARKKHSDAMRRQMQCEDFQKKRLSSLLAKCVKNPNYKPRKLRPKKGSTEHRAMMRGIALENIRNSGKSYGHTTSVGVLCVELGREFVSLTEAVDWLKSVGFPKACNGRLSRASSLPGSIAYGYRWKRIEP